MQNEELLDDFHFQPEEDAEVYLEPASLGQRFINSFIDNIVIRVLGYTLGLMLGTSEILTDDALLIFALFLGIFMVFGYYWICEFALGGQTLGKLASGTKVVYDDGTRPSGLSILGRSLARAVPFEAFSIFFDSDRLMWHDKWSHTMVIDIKKSILPTE